MTHTPERMKWVRLPTAATQRESEGGEWLESEWNEARRVKRAEGNDIEACRGMKRWMTRRKGRVTPERALTAGPFSFSIPKPQKLKGLDKGMWMTEERDMTAHSLPISLCETRRKGGLSPILFSLSLAFPSILLFLSSGECMRERKEMER